MLVSDYSVTPDGSGIVVGRASLMRSSTKLAGCAGGNVVGVSMTSWMWAAQGCPCRQSYHKLKHLPLARFCRLALVHLKVEELWHWPEGLLLIRLSAHFLWNMGFTLLSDFSILRRGFQVGYIFGVLRARLAQLC